MDRSTNKHGPRLDDEMKHEVEGQMRAGRPTRAEQWHDPEPVEDENSPQTSEEIERRRAAERGRTHSAQSEASPERDAGSPDGAPGEARGDGEGP